MHADRVRETSATLGTGTLNLGGAVPNFQSFITAFGTGAKVFYVAVLNTEWEIGIGTVTSGSPDTLSRDQVLQSSNADALVNFSTGSKSVFGALPAQMWCLPDITDFTTSGAINNLDPGARGAFRITAATSITGITGGGKGKVHLIINDSGARVLIANESGSSTAANRILTGYARDAYLPAAGLMLVWYDFTESRWRQMGAKPTTKVTVYTSGSGTHNVEVGCKEIHVEGIGGGGGGSGSGTGPGNGGTGGTTQFGTAGAEINCTGGTGGAAGGAVGAGGTATNGTLNLNGAPGGYSAQTATAFAGGHGAGSYFGGGANGGDSSPSAGAAGTTNTGAGGGGGGYTATGSSSRGGGSGAYSRKVIANPATSYAYAVGGTGSAGTGGTSGAAGGAGGSGLLIVTEMF